MPSRLEVICFVYIGLYRYKNRVNPETLLKFVINQIPHCFNRLNLYIQCNVNTDKIQNNLSCDVVYLGVDV